MSNIIRADAANSVLRVIDLQEKLLPVIADGEAIVQRALFLIQVAALLGVPTEVTEQYPQGLGPTLSILRPHFTTVPRAKTRFSCVETHHANREAEGLTHILVGVETHVCVLQTALDLAAAGKQVIVPVDAVGSRHACDHSFALRRMEQAGVCLTTVEAIAFEWLRDATHPAFKEVSKLVRALSPFPHA